MESELGYVQIASEKIIRLREFFSANRKRCAGIHLETIIRRKMEEFSWFWIWRRKKTRAEVIRWLKREREYIGSRWDYWMGIWEDEEANLNSITTASLYGNVLVDIEIWNEITTAERDMNRLIRDNCDITLNENKEPIP